MFTVRRLYPFGQYSFSLERLNGTEYAAISMTRTGNRLTTADVTEWDGDDEMEYSIYNYNHNANGAMTFDSMIGEEGATLRWNVAGLLHTITDEESGEGATYVWLSDGTKVKMDGDVDSPRYYRGSFVYKDVSISVPTGYDEGDYDTYDFEGLESIAHSEGRFVATDWTTTGVPTLSDRHFVRDLVGSTVTVIDVARAAVASNLPTLNAALVEQDAYLAYGDRLSASAMTLKTDTDNRYRFNGKERHDWAGYPYIDYGARMYNPVIGSWLSPDPLAEFSKAYFSYSFCLNNPINYYDPFGLTTYVVEGEERVIDDGYTDRMNVTEHQYRALERRFSKNALRYERYRNNLQLSYGYQSEGDIPTNEGASVAWHKPHKISFQEWNQSAIGNLSTSSLSALKETAEKIEESAGKTRFELSGKIRKEGPKGGVFYGNQYVQTYSVAKCAKTISSVASGTSIVIGAYGVANAFIEDGLSIGYHTRASIGELAGGYVGGILGAALGAAAVGAIGSSGAGVGAVPGAAAGVFVGAMVGSYYGSYGGIYLIQRVL